jgi:hypothetical protein
MVTQVAAAAATTGSTLGTTYQALVFLAELATVINMIAANQQALYQHIAPLTQQMAAMSYQKGMQARQPAHQPPSSIYKLVIPQLRFTSVTRGVATLSDKVVGSSKVVAVKARDKGVVDMDDAPRMEVGDVLHLLITFPKEGDVEATQMVINLQLET